MRELVIQMTASYTNVLEGTNTTWEQLLKLLEACQPHGSLQLQEYLAADSATKRKEKDYVGWMPCSVKNQGGRRIQENMDMLHLLVLDIDDGLPLGQIHEVLAQYEYAVHSSYSHTPEKPKWRVVLPLAEPIPAADLPALFDRVHALFGGKLDAACGHDCARMYFLPGCPPDAEHLFVFEHHRGDWLHAVSMLSKASEVAEILGSAVLGPIITSATGINFENGYPDGQRTNELARRAGHCFAMGMTLEEAKSRCLQWNMFNTPPLEEAKIISTVESIARTHERGEIEMKEHSARVIEDMNRQYAWIERHGMIYRFRFRDLVSADRLRQQLANTHIRAIHKGKPKDLTHAEAWLSSPDRRKFDDLVFVPGKPEIHDGSINLWRGWGIEPVAGDIAPWNQLLDHLFNGDVEMRRWFECWAAYPIQHPGEKMNTAVVFWSSQQGVGKTLIGETIGLIYGEHFKTISATELHGSFNGWARDCQFVLGEENSSADHRADSNKLKHLITGSTVFVNEKYQPAMVMDNRVNFIFTSNHPDAFHLEAHDRRFFVWSITAPKMSDEFYKSFVQWRDKGGVAALMHYFLQLELGEFNAKASAPLTESKQEMIEISRSEVERWIHETFDDDATIMGVFGREVATMDEVIRAYHGEHPHGRCNTTAMSRALRRKHRYSSCRTMTRHGRKSLISLTNHDVWDGRESRAWVDEYTKPLPMSL
jgi:hypothetical protein